MEFCNDKRVFYSTGFIVVFDQVETQPSKIACAARYEQIMQLVNKTPQWRSRALAVPNKSKAILQREFL